MDIDLLRMLLRLLITRAKALGLREPSGDSESVSRGVDEEGEGGTMGEVRVARGRTFSLRRNLTSSTSTSLSGCNTPTSIHRYICCVLLFLSATVVLLLLKFMDFG